MDQYSPIVKSRFVLADPILTFEEPSGRVSVLEKLRGGDAANFPMPEDPRQVGDWIGITVSDGGWPAPQYLVDLESGSVRRMQKNTMLTALSPDGGRAIVNQVVNDERAPQRVVEIPPTSG